MERYTGYDAKFETPFFIVPNAKFETPFFITPEYETNILSDNEEFDENFETPLFIDGDGFNENLEKRIYNTSKPHGGESPEYWQNYISLRINSSNEETSRKAANFMIENVLRYHNEDKILTREGYTEIRKNWNKIIQNSTIDKEKLKKAQNALLVQYHRLETKAEKEPELKSEETYGTYKHIEHRYPIQTEIEPEIKSLWSRTISKVTNAISKSNRFSFGRA